jgi:hypothetical protein
MTETARLHETTKQRWTARLLTAVCEKCFAWICQFPTGFYTPETMMFMNYTGFGIEETVTFQIISRIKQDARYEK